jgi:hypothetical protein
MGILPFGLHEALESFEDCLLDSMGYGYNYCYCNGLDELMIPLPTYLSWSIFLLFLACSFRFFMLRLLALHTFCILFFTIDEYYELPFPDPTPGCVLGL